jgi:enoyl-CoA hydratase/carnithine racemase
MTPERLAEAGLHYAVDGAVATVTLDRPEVRNAQTPAMWHALRDLGAAIPDEVRVVVLRGNGHSFSAGLDRYQQGFTWLRDPRFVSVAAIQGYAIGAGFQLALSCDLRIVTEDAQLCMKESALGLVPDLTGTKPLVECVGYARALEICATARMVGAVEAVQIGLALTAVPADRLDATVADLVTALTAPLAGAVSETKRLLLSAAATDLEEQRRLEREAQARRFRELASLMTG